MNKFRKAEIQVCDLSDRLIIALRNAGEALQETEHEDAIFAAESVATDLEYGDELTNVIRALQKEMVK